MVWDFIYWQYGDWNSFSKDEKKNTEFQVAANHLGLHSIRFNTEMKMSKLIIEQEISIIH